MMQCIEKGLKKPVFEVFPPPMKDQHHYKQLLGTFCIIRVAAYSVNRISKAVNSIFNTLYFSLLYFIHILIFYCVMMHLMLHQSERARMYAHRVQSEQLNEME